MISTKKTLLILFVLLCLTGTAYATTTIYNATIRNATIYGQDSVTGFMLLDDGSSYVVLDDGTSKITLAL